MLSLVFAAGLTACGNNDKMTTETDPGVTNVQNVNGNMPDTNGSITLDNNTLTQDSSRVVDTLMTDSAPRQ